MGEEESSVEGKQVLLSSFEVVWAAKTDRFTLWACLCGRIHLFSPSIVLYLIFWFCKLEEINGREFLFFCKNLRSKDIEVKEEEGGELVKCYPMK